MSKLRVYYNSACPVCDAGIKGQRQRMQGCGAEIDWIDIHRDAEALRGLGVEREFVRERLHVLDENGALHVGADAFGQLWQLTPQQRRMRWLTTLPLVRTLTRWSYNVFARALYVWNRVHRRW